MKNNTLPRPSRTRTYRNTTRQDRIYAVLPFLFLLFLPVFPLFPHSSLVTAAAVLTLVGLGLAARGVSWDRSLFFFLALLLLTLSGVTVREARAPSLLACALMSAYLLPRLYDLDEGAVASVLSVAGGACGGATCLQYLAGGGATGYADARFGALARAVGSFGNPNLLAAFLTPCLVLSLYAVLGARRRPLRLLHGAAALFSFLGLGLSFCRGGWLAAALSLLVSLAFLRGPLLPLSLVATAPLLALFLPTAVKQRLYSFAAPDSSVGYRGSLWRSLLRTPPALWPFGAGEGKAALHRLLSPIAAAGLERVEHTHSLYLHFFVSVGVVGLLCFIALLVCRLGRWRTHTATTAALCSLLLFGLFDDPLYSAPIAALFFFLLGCGARKPSEKETLL